MGLAAPKQKRKIGLDPNNATWARDTARFGHKILASQGWKPGETLGAENASHASHYTSASSSHIRVLLREDGLGLGAKNGRQEADRFGLDMFQGLLGRLNGKSEAELQKEAGYRRDLNLKEMVVKRFGGTTFVSGGYLVGDKIERDIPVESSPADLVVIKEKKSKKRKRMEDLIEGAESSNAASNPVIESSADESAIKKEKRKSKKEKKRNEVESADEDDKDTKGASEDDAPAGLSEKELKRRRKAERRAAKEARRQDKAEKKRKRREDELKEEAIATVSSTTTDTSETEATSDASGLQKTAAVPRGRFAVRARYSQQKRLAASDQQALKEIFMIKAGA